MLLCSLFFKQEGFDNTLKERRQHGGEKCSSYNLSGVLSPRKMRFFLFFSFFLTFEHSKQTWQIFFLDKGRRRYGKKDLEVRGGRKRKQIILSFMVFGYGQLPSLCRRLQVTSSPRLALHDNKKWNYMSKISSHETQWCSKTRNDSFLPIFPSRCCGFIQKGKIITHETLVNGVGSGVCRDLQGI